MRVPTMHGVIRRRLLVNFRAEPEVVQRRVQLDVAGRMATELPAASIFRTVDEASAFFEPGSVGYSAAAFLTMLMPPDVMAAIHERLGLGPFPRSPVVDYLARSAAGLYGFHGVLVLLVSTDPVRYRPVVTYIGVMHLTFGMMIIAIDSVAGMPWWWTAGEGPAIIPFGVILLVLNRSAVHSDDHAGNLAS